jgi:drug/metabolite transporter (DMT)-like permease
VAGSQTVAAIRGGPRGASVLSNPYLLWGAVALVVAGWSGNYIAGKIALREFPAALLSPLRLWMAAAFMLPFWAWERHRTRDTRAPRQPGDIRTLMVVGLLGASATQFLWVLGLGRTNVAHAVIFGNLAPILVLLMASAQGMERLTSGKLGGLVLALAGVVMLRWLDTPSHAAQAPTWTGDALCFGGSMTFAFFNVYGKPATKRHSGVTVSAFGYFAGALAVAPLMLWQGGRFSFGHVSAVGWAAAVYMSLVSSVLCYLLYYRVLARLDASRASAFGYLQPPVATVFGAIVLGEMVTPALALAGAVILAGLILAERSR